MASLKIVNQIEDDVPAWKNIVLQLTKAYQNECKARKHAENEVKRMEESMKTDSQATTSNDIKTEPLDSDSDDGSGRDWESKRFTKLVRYSESPETRTNSSQNGSYSTRNGSKSTKSGSIFRNRSKSSLNGSISTPSRSNSNQNGSNSPQNGSNSSQNSPEISDPDPGYVDYEPMLVDDFQPNLNETRRKTRSESNRHKSQKNAQDVIGQVSH